MLVTKAFSYLRVSSPEQRKGDSLRRQVEASRKFAQAHGLELDEGLSDIGISAYRGANRYKGALARFLQLVREGKVPKGSFLLVESLDRLSREQVLDALKLFIEIIDADITIATILDGQIYEKEAIQGDFTRLIISLSIMARAHEESRVKAQRLGAAWDQKRKDVGRLKLTAMCPHWLKLSPEKTNFVVEEDKVSVIKRIFEMSASGMGRHSIARVLNEDRIPSLMGKSWNASGIHHLLTSDAVLGSYQPHSKRSGERLPHGEPITGYYPRILDADLVARARAAVASRRLGHAGRK
jgi:DNA invertase Pin-like site-specific DNA recombinase